MPYLEWDNAVCDLRNQDPLTYLCYLTACTCSGQQRRGFGCYINSIGYYTVAWMGMVQTATASTGTTSRTMAGQGEANQAPGSRLHDLVHVEIQQSGEIVGHPAAGADEGMLVGVILLDIWLARSRVLAFTEPLGFDTHAAEATGSDAMQAEPTPCWQATGAATASTGQKSQQPVAAGGGSLQAAPAQPVWAKAVTGSDATQPAIGLSATHSATAQPPSSGDGQQAGAAPVPCAAAAAGSQVEKDTAAAAAGAAATLLGKAGNAECSVSLLPCPAMRKTAPACTCAPGKT